MNNEIFNNVKENKNELLLILNYIGELGITNENDIYELYNNSFFKNTKILKTYEEWNELGYRIKPGMHGIKLYRGQDKKQVYFDIRQVYGVKDKEKEIKGNFIKNPKILLEEGTESNGFYTKYLKDIRNEVKDSVEENEKIIIENLASHTILKRFEYFNQKDTLIDYETEKRDLFETIELLNSKIFEDKDVFDRILYNTIELSNQKISSIYKEAKNNGLIEQWTLDKTTKIYHTENTEEVKDNKNKNERKEEKIYGSDKETNNINDREDGLGRDRENEEGNGEQIGRDETSDVAYGRYERDNRETTRVHTDSKQLYDDSRNIQGTTQLYERNNERVVGESKSLQQDEIDFMGRGNENEPEDGVISRRSGTRFDENPLQNIIKEQEEDKNNNEFRERTDEGIIKESRANTKQVDNIANIFGELQEHDKSDISRQNEIDNATTTDERVSIDERSKSEEIERNKSSSERRDDNGNTNGTIVNKDNEKIEEDKSSIFNEKKDIPKIEIDRENFYGMNKEKDGVSYGIDKEKFIKYLEENKGICKNNSKISIEDETIVAHIFNPYGNQDWFITDYEKEGDDVILFGWCNLGDEQNAELGYTSLNEILKLRAKNFIGEIDNRLPMQVETHSFTLGQRIKDFVKTNSYSYGMDRLVDNSDFTDINNTYNIVKIKNLEPKIIENIILENKENNYEYDDLSKECSKNFEKISKRLINEEKIKTFAFTDKNDVHWEISYDNEILKINKNDTVYEYKVVSNSEWAIKTQKTQIQAIGGAKELFKSFYQDSVLHYLIYPKNIGANLFNENYLNKIIENVKPINSYNATKNDKKEILKDVENESFINDYVNTEVIDENNVKHINYTERNKIVSEITNRETLLNADYVNTEEQNEITFNKAEKFDDNIIAIKTLKKIEEENRLATKEEQKLLSKYVGWGGLANYCFDKQRSNKEKYELVKELLTEEEYKSAVRSVNDAYYTPDFVVKEIYKKIEEFGFKGGKILEPSCGVGKFFANMPKEIREKSEITGIEVDNISARIAKVLYPSMTIKNKGFEKENIKNETYNLIIGNIPFGQNKLYDKEYKKENLLIHDYFINKSLDKLADGGICAIISSTGTLDKKDDKARELFSEKANFLGAVRLPAGTFGDTEAQTDILFFQKNKSNMLGINQEFVKAEGIYNSEKDLFSKNRIYKNTITEETYHYIRYAKAKGIMDENMWKDIFVGLKQGDMEEAFTENDYNNYSIMYDETKINELKEKYELWVKNGKNPDEKPIYDTKKDFYLLDSYIDFDKIETLKQIYECKIDVGVENPNYYEITKNKKGEVKVSHNKNITEKYLHNIKQDILVEVPEEKIYDDDSRKQIFNISINSYYKNNIDKVIGRLHADTGIHGKPIMVSNLKEIEAIKDGMQKGFNDIKCTYYEQVKDETLDKNANVEYISENEYEQKEIYKYKKYSHFVYNGKVCFNEKDKAYYVNGLNNKEEEQLKALIKLKETAHQILQFEEKGELGEAEKSRNILRETYNVFYDKYKERINSKEIKKLIEEDDDKGLLLSLEVGVNEPIDEIKVKKKALKNPLNEEDIIETKTLSNGITVDVIEDNDGNQKYYDKDGNEYIVDTKVNFIIKDGDEGLAQIFKEPLIKKKTELLSVDNAKDGLILSLQTQGKVDLDFIKEKSNLSTEQIIDDLRGQIYYDYRQNEYITRDEFLSGNIYLKIDEYNEVKDELIKENETLKERIDKLDNEENIEELFNKLNENEKNISNISIYIEDLQKVIPKKIDYEDIDISLGATWFPIKYYNKFILDELKIRCGYYGMNLTLNDKITPSEFVITNKKYVNIDNSVELKYGTEDKNSIEILENAINLREIKVYDTINENGQKKQVINIDKTGLANQKIEDLKNAFIEWKKTKLNNEEKKEIEDIYNRKFNGTVSREYNGDILEFPNMNKNITFKKHQKDAVARMVFGENTGLAHEVGLGKTYEICAGVMTFKQLGLANKSMIVVPKPLVEQWQREFLTLYPTANVIAPNEKDFNKENRQKFLSKIATGNYDAIILSQEQFQKIPLSKERQERYIKKQLDEYEDYLNEIKFDISLDNNAKKLTIKGIESEINRLRTNLENLKNEDYKDNTISFEEMHIDKLFVDEAHYYKNSYFATKLTRVAGIQSKSTKRTFDLQMKCKYLNEKTNNRGIYLATGTPITNSIVECYTMMKYLEEDNLKKIGIKSLDDFVANFCDIKTCFELDSTGSNLHLKTRINTFKNVPEVIRLFKNNWDIKTLKDVKNDIKVPKAKRTEVVNPATITQQELMQTFIERCEKMQPGHTFDPKKDNMLKLTNDGKMAALDPRLYYDKYPDEEGTKVNSCVENVIKKYFETMEQKGTQIIFSDIGVPKKDAFDIYNDIKNKLIENGINKNEIAFIGDYDTPEKKQQMQNLVNEGKIRVLISSTDKGGTGLNIQKKLCALHHLSLPWKPSDMQQREGRIIRQGNDFSEVEIFTYIQQSTFDARTFEILNNKSKMINQIMQGDGLVRRYDNIGQDENTINYDDFVQMALPDSNIKQEKELERDIKILEAEKNQFEAKMRDNQIRLREIPKEIENCENIMSNQKIDMERLNNEKEKPFEMKIFGKDIGDIKVYSDRQDATKRLYQRMYDEDKSIFYKTEPIKIAEYKGFDVFTNFQPCDKVFAFRLKSKETGYLYNNVDFGTSDVGNMTRLDNFINSINEDRINEHDKKIKYLENEQKNIEESLNLSFSKADLLESKKKELKELLLQDEIKKEELKFNAINKSLDELDNKENKNNIVKRC